MPTDPDSLKGGEQLNIRISDDVQEVIEFVAFLDYRLGATADVVRGWIAEKLDEEKEPGSAPGAPVIDPSLVIGGAQFNLRVSGYALDAIHAKGGSDRLSQDILRGWIGEKIAEEIPDLRELLEKTTAGLEDGGRLSDILAATNRLCPPEK